MKPGLRRGIFAIAEVTGPAGERVRALQQRYDPKLAASGPPHITLAGSSGIGSISSWTTVDQLRAALAPIARDTPPIPLRFERPERFMQTEIVVLPLDPHGPLRTLHERIASSGLEYERSRFSYSPHCTLNLFRTLPPDELRALLAERVEEEFTVDRVKLILNPEPKPQKLLLELELTG